MSDATRLRGDGEEITMADGSVERIIFDFDALCEIEETCGSLGLFNTALAAGSRAQILNTVAKGVAAGLRHLPEPPTVADVRRRLDSRLAQSYVEAVDKAFNDAMPQAEEETEGKASGRTSDSPGTSTTTSPPSDSAEATASSGG